MTRKKQSKKKQPMLSSRVATQLAEAERLMARRQWDQAETILRPLAHSHPTNVDVLSMLGHIYSIQQNGLSLWDVTEKLTRLDSHEPAHWANLAMASIANRLPFAALHYSNYFLERWPDHDYADKVREILDTVHPVCADIMESEHNSSPDASAEEFMLFELSQMAFNRGDFKQGEKVALEAIRRLPDAIPPRNNLALAYMMQGEFEKAVAVSRQVLERQPENVHALANLAQTLFRMGQQNEARQIAAKLRQQGISDDDVSLAKVVETLATLGDDATVIEIYEEADHVPVPTTHHLAAVAYARRGNTERAKKVWEQTLKLEPYHDTARKNMADIKKPVGERNGAWPFPIHQWIPQPWLKILVKTSEQSQRSDAIFEREMKRVLHDMPYLKAILPSLLERGDPEGRQLALMLAMQADLPLLRDFSLGENGTDQDRINAARHAIELGLLPQGHPVSLLIRGERKELLLTTFEIYTEQEPSTLSDEAQELLEEAHDMLAERRAREAEVAARQALELAPDYPALLNYLTSALRLQNRHNEADEVVRHTVTVHPDYLFGRVAMIQILVYKGQLEEARQWLEPLLERSRFHISEYAAFCMAHVELLIAEKEYDGAQTWLDMWHEVDPDNPNLQTLKIRLLKRRSLRRK